jgi:hypothetical protein
MNGRNGTAGIALAAWFIVALAGLVLSRKTQILKCTTCDTVVSDLS